MNLLWSLLLLPPYLQLEAWQIDPPTTQVILTIASTQALSDCPVCHEAARRVHSHYERTLADLPWSEYSVSWQLQVRKFFCTNPNCFRRIFTPAAAWGGGPLGTEDHKAGQTAECDRFGTGGSCRKVAGEPSRTENQPPVPATVGAPGVLT